MRTDFTPTQRRALGIVTAIALAFGAYFLSRYFMLLVIAAVVAYLFTPLHDKLKTKVKPGLATTFTVIAALLTVVIPLSGVIALATVQISRMLIGVADWAKTADLNALGDRVMTSVNNLLHKLPFQTPTITLESLRSRLGSVAQSVGEWLLNTLSGIAGSAIGLITSTIIFLYVLISLLNNRAKLITLIRRLNPLGPEVTDLYLAKMGAMVKGTVKGQFIIATIQGILGSCSIWIAGFHGAFFIFAIFLTALSMIPLGSGIVTIPFGIALMFFGNVGGGLFIVLFHIFGITNVDNFLRPILVPKKARLDPALMLLSVFCGIAMFGFFGIVIGPVIMILIVTTISVYLAVYKGVAMREDEDDDDDDDDGDDHHDWKDKLPFRRRKTEAPVSDEGLPEEVLPVLPADTAGANAPTSNVL